MKTENPLIKNALLTASFYILLLIVRCLLNIISPPSGHCYPGLGEAIMFGFPFVSGFFLALNLTKYLIGNKSIIVSLIIHFLIFASCLIFVKTV